MMPYISAEYFESSRCGRSALVSLTEAIPSGMPSAGQLDLSSEGKCCLARRPTTPRDTDDRDFARVHIDD
jgi:hypothetical protein